jgi:hypothetical protein
MNRYHKKFMNKILDSDMDEMDKDMILRELSRTHNIMMNYEIIHERELFKLYHFGIEHLNRLLEFATEDEKLVQELKKLAFNGMEYDKIKYYYY